MGERKKKHDLTIDQVEKFESRLHSSLPPVLPNQQFVDQLRTRLLNPSTTTLEETRHPIDTLLAVGVILFFIAMSILLGVKLKQRISS